MYKCFFVRFPLCSGNIKLYSPYLMDHESNPDMPLLADGKIVFFKTKNSAINFMHNHFRNVSYNDEPAYEFDTETFIKNVRTGYQRGIVIDILNIIFDYLSAIKVENYPFFSRKIISDLDVSKRKERVIPYLSYLISAGVGVYILYRMQIPFWLLSILTSSLIAIAIAACINIFWKISVHCIAIGGLLGGLMGISYIYSINPFWGFIAGFLIAGLVGTARVELRRHTLGQVFAGFALGFACTFVSSSLSFIYLFI